MRKQGWRALIAALIAIIILAPVALVVWQSFLSAPFYSARARPSLAAYHFVLGDGDFWGALANSLLLSASMVAIAVPLGSLLAFLIVRTDLPGRRWVEPAIFLPLFVSPMVLAFGYIVAAGPVGFISTWWEAHVGPIGWNIYSFVALALVVGLTHIPHVYIYVSAALRTVPSDLEEAARVAGARPLMVATRVTLPLVWPSIAVSAVLIFFIGFELFGLPYVLGDPEGRLVLATYLYKLTSRLGTPSYQLMAVVVLAIMLFTLPLVLIQRRLLRSVERHATLRGKAARPHLVPLGAWRWVALGGIALWLVLVVVVPLAGITFRSFVSSWGATVTVSDVLTLDNYRALGALRGVGNSIINTLIIAIPGGLLSVSVYVLIGLAAHRSASWTTRALDYLVLLPRAMPGIVAGLVIFWIFLFVPVLKPFVATLATVWLAYTLVWMPFGLRLVANSFGQVGRELEEAASVTGAGQARVARDVVIPLARHGLAAAWLLTFLLFVREYSTGIYLLAPGTEVMGAMLVNLWTSGNMAVVSALSVINTAVIAVGIALALRLGVRLDA
ncbi:ABC transporter permease [Methylobacterium sp. WSM2598]|uniref:ABC transporter permease n=1 Tax=Methylobacterium sp. WSM2598 TaxID=398261 RepID=UPI000373DD9E|nr:iron ABC transporter permease [Methylobacterium sp. WSM2598]